MINRDITNSIKNRIKNSNRIVIIYGARQLGKTTLALHIIKDLKLKTLHINADLQKHHDILSSRDLKKLKNLTEGYDLLFIDEAQRISNIGLTFKLITDKIKNIQVIATGSSSFEMANKMNEPLTGRKFEFKLYPLSFQEMVDHHGLIEEKRQLEQRLIYGAYPEVVINREKSAELLNLIADSYLYKDLLMLDSIKRPRLLEKILRALALQIGSEVSFNELARLVEADKGTVEKYIQLFEQTFILFQLPSWSRNARNELKKSKKIYFYDCGIRNAVIGNFSPIRIRADIGVLWENYLISERMKKLQYKNSRANSYFWRTTQQQEVDYIEEKDDQLFAYEFKWNTKKKVKITKSFTNAYPKAKTEIVTPENFENFLLKTK